MGRPITGKKINNRGSAMIMTLAVVSLVAILGAVAMSAALVNLKMRDLNRRSDRNFYYLETALEEIYASAGTVAAESLKKSYSEVVGGLYREDMMTNQSANEAFQKLSIELLKAAFGVTELNAEPAPLSEAGLVSTDEELCRSVAEHLKSYSETLEKNLEASLEAVVLEGSGGIDPDSGIVKGERFYDTLIFRGFSLTYTEEETGIQSSLTTDLTIRVPLIRFMNEGDSLFDYVLVSNGALCLGEPEGQSVIWGPEGGMADISIKGNVYGGSVKINVAEVEADSSLFTSGSQLAIERGGSLSIGKNEAGEGEDREPGEDAGENDENAGVEESENGRLNRVWALNLDVSGGSHLLSNNTDFYIQDDMKLDGNDNLVRLDGRYYGYGNEGAGETESNLPENSSAILLNGKYNTVDLRGLDTLMLAGRAYLQFQSKENRSRTGSGGSSVSNPQYVYPMGESLAVRATQVMYLVPEKDMKLIYNGTELPAGSNPAVLPESVDSAVLSALIPKEITGNGSDETVQFTLNRGSDSGEQKRITADSPANPHALLIELHGKFYLYYDFDSNEKRTEYFERYLKEKGENFDDFLKRAGTTGTSGDGSVRLNEGGQILTSGALYQVAGADDSEAGRLFRLLKLKKGEVGGSLVWAQLSQNMKTTFENLKANLAETRRVNHLSGVSGAEALLPAGNYVRLADVTDMEEDPRYTVAPEEGSAVFLSGADLTVTLKDGGAQVRAKGETGAYSIPGGLIISAGNITVTSDDDDTAEFKGLIMAGGDITVACRVRLTADPELYQALLEDEKVSQYFYHYGDAASTVLDDYTDYVTRENWVRAGRETGGGT